MIGDEAWVFASAGATATGCRKRALPTAAWCDEAVTGVMASRS